jgi:hypothetical protein
MKILANNIVEVKQDGLTAEDVQRILKKRGDDKVHCIKISRFMLDKCGNIVGYQFEVHTDREVWVV